MFFYYKTSFEIHIRVYDYIRNGRSFDRTQSQNQWFYRSRGSEAAEWRSTVHVQSSALPRILSAASASASDCHSHTHSLFIFTSAPMFSLPGFNMPSFILHFSEDSIYLLYIFH